MGIFNLFSKGKSWTLVGTTVVDPQNVTGTLCDKLSPATLEKTLFGYTTYIWQNDETGDIRKDEYLGLDETPLRTLLSKVDQWGKYEVLLDGKKYAIVKLQENSVIPVVTESSPLISVSDISRLPVR